MKPQERLVHTRDYSVHVLVDEIINGFHNHRIMHVKVRDVNGITIGQDNYIYFLHYGDIVGAFPKEHVLGYTAEE